MDLCEEKNTKYDDAFKSCWLHGFRKLPLPKFKSLTVLLHEIGLKNIHIFQVFSVLSTVAFNVPFNNYLHFVINSLSLFSFIINYINLAWE